MPKMLAGNWRPVPPLGPWFFRPAPILFACFVVVWPRQFMDQNWWRLHPFAVNLPAIAFSVVCLLALGAFVLDLSEWSDKKHRREHERAWDDKMRAEEAERGRRQAYRERLEAEADRRNSERLNEGARWEVLPRTCEACGAEPDPDVKPYLYLLDPEDETRALVQAIPTPEGFKDLRFGDRFILRVDPHQRATDRYLADLGAWRIDDEVDS